VTWLQRKNNWTSNDIQNEIIQIMADSVLRSIAYDFKAKKHFSIFIDETTDSSFKNKPNICLRHVDIRNLNVHENFARSLKLKHGDGDNHKIP